MKLQVLGTGCSKCKSLEENARRAIEDTGEEAQIETVYDLAEASAMGMMDAPGLAVDGEIRVQGRVADRSEIVELIEASA